MLKASNKNELSVSSPHCPFGAIAHCPCFRVRRYLAINRAAYRICPAHALFNENGPLTDRKVSLEQLQLPAQVKKQLLNGETVALQNTNQQTYYYQYKDESLRIIGPITTVQSEDQNHSYIATFFYLGFALILLLWFRPAIRDFRLLSKSIVEFAKTAKWQPVPLKNSSIAFPTANTINVMAARIEHLMELQKSLARMVGHEIRTPLARTQFSIASLKYEPSIEEILSIEEDINEIEELTEEFLKITKLEFYSDKLTLSMQSPYPMIAELVNRLNKVSNVKIRLLVDENLRAPIEIKTFKRLLQNLITNALKHTRSTIKVSLESKNGRNILTVSDDGPGFNSTNSLQSTFYQEDTSKDGYGLGLAIVNMIATWYKGEVSFTKSESLGGAKVIFTW